MNFPKPSVPFDKAQKSATLGKEGIEQLKNGDYFEAISSFDKAIEYDPNALYAFQYRAICKCIAFSDINNSATGEERRIYLQESLSDLETAAETIKTFIKGLDAIQSGGD